MPSTSGSWQGPAVEKGARMAKLAKASERLVSCSAADILKQDFDAVFGTALPGNDMHSLPQMKTWMASTFADRAHRAQAEAISDQQIAEFISRLEVQFQDSAPHAIGVSQAMTDLQESVRIHEKRARLQMLRNQLEQQELCNKKQADFNMVMSARMQAAKSKLDRDTCGLMAELCDDRGLLPTTRPAA
ncbi:unnamed protein product [Symbiodinium natans]|uniref:Uncharacterized protein n=1 Tax=Symbiodinium natans TaxID=878477 RepID=A0A812VFX1_9DINO|nr:unnamed protein product [Symbiodinium natans]